MLCLPNNLRSATTKPPARVSSPRRANRAPGTRARPGRRSARASPINRLVLNLIERVVVGGNTRIVNLFETNDDRVSHAGLVDGDDLAVIVEPVRLRAQNLNLRGGNESASKPQSSRSVTRSMDETSRTRARASHTRRETATRERLSVGWRARRRVSSSSQWVMTPRRVPRPRPLASRARAHLGASRRADLFLGRRLRLRRRLLSRIKNTHPSSVTAPNPTARRVDAHRHRSSIHRVSNESSNHHHRIVVLPQPRRERPCETRAWSSSPCETDAKKRHPSVGFVIERSRASRERFVALDRSHAPIAIPRGPG